MTLLSRRGFLAASSAAALPLFLPLSAMAAPLRQLRATTRTLDIGGRAITVKGILDANGRSGVMLEPGEAFRLDLVNELTEDTILHWHGQHAPNAQDGVPDMPQPALKPGETRSLNAIFNSLMRQWLWLSRCPMTLVRAVTWIWA